MARMQGRGAKKYISGLWNRIFGSIFILFSLGIILFSGLSLTGNVVLSQAAVGDIGFVLSFALGIIGFLLLTRER